MVRWWKAQGGTWTHPWLKVYGSTPQTETFMLALQVAANLGFDVAVRLREGVQSEPSPTSKKEEPALRHAVPRSSAERQQSHRVERGCLLVGRLQSFEWLVVTVDGMLTSRRTVKVSPISQRSAKLKGKGVKHACRRDSCSVSDRGRGGVAAGDVAGHDGQRRGGTRHAPFAVLVRCAGSSGMFLGENRLKATSSLYDVRSKGSAGS